MNATNEHLPTPTRAAATTEQTSERELVVTRTINGPARVVYEAWTTPELFQRWWVPKSFPFSLVTCELDVRVGGGYRLVFRHDGGTSDFFGRYLEVTPNARLVWTNDEAGADGPITTVTFEASDGATVVRVHDLFPSREALDAAKDSGSTTGMPESLAQLDELVASLNEA